MKDALVTVALMLAFIVVFLAGLTLGYSTSGPHTVTVTLTCKPTQVQDIPNNPPIYTYQCEAGR